MANDHDEPQQNERPRNNAAPKNTHTIHPQKGGDKGGGNAGKWLAGAAVVALLVGGGYYLTQNSSAPSQSIALMDENSSASMPVDNQTEAPVAETASTSSESTAAARRASANEPAEETLGVTLASASSGGGDEIVVPGTRRPVWERRPSARRLSEAYPARALERGQEGEAQVSCTVIDEGRMDCVKVSESPERAGFGAAAVRVAEMHRHSTYRADGTAAAGTPVNLRVLFRQGEDGRRGYN